MESIVKTGFRGLFVALTILALLALFAGCATAGRTDTPASGGLPASALSQSDNAAAMDQLDPPSLTGTVVSRVEAKGTLSEYEYFLLNTGSGAPILLFNAKGYSAGFGDWDGVLVTVTGERFEGRIGNGLKRAKGFRVQSIRRAE